MKDEEVSAAPPSETNGLTGNLLVDSLPEVSRERLAPLLKRKVLEPGVTLARPGETTVRIFFPVTSVISEYQILRDGRTLEVALTGREGVVGLHAVLGEQPAPNFAESIIRGEAFEASAEEFRELLEEMPRLTSAMFDYLNGYFTQVSHRVICSNYHSIEQRLCLWLLMVRDRTGRDSVEITQEKLGSVLGAQRPSVTVVTQEMRDKGMIDYDRGVISLLDPGALETGACNCYEDLRLSGVLRAASG